MATTEEGEVQSDIKQKTRQQFLDARTGWDERYGDLITRAKNWRIAFLMMGVLACLQATALIVEMRRSHVVPFVVAVDGLHQVVGMGLATETGPTDPRLIQARIQQYIEDARSISSDQAVLKERLEKVFDATVLQSPANNFLVEYYRAESPFELSSDGTVQIQVHNITPLTATSYEVTWTEMKRDKAGNSTVKEEWKGVLGVVISPPKNEADARKNPLGVYVNAITWSKSV
jgi:type IV secretion system protein TrbF